MGILSGIPRFHSAGQGPSETDGEDHGNGLEPNHTYDDYTCVMTRLSSADIFWEIAEFGNG